jgi:predicted ArsR family transcriptional regulator
VGDDSAGPPSGRRTTVAEAADLLGISAEAVRGRIRRGTLPVERDGGTVYVLVDKPEPGRTTADQSRTTADRTDDRTDALIETLARQVEDLREQVRAERQAHAEARRIIAGLVERIPAIEAPQEPSESPQSEASPGPTETLTDAGGEAQEPDTRPWWQRWFGSVDR